MTRILCFGDLHLGAGRDHRADALADHAHILEQIAALAFERGVDLILNAGDTFDRPQPPVAAQHVWQKFVRALDALEIPMVTILGNAGHDQVNSATATAVELHEGPLHRVSRRPEVVDLAGVKVCTLPSVPVHRLVAEHPELGRGDVNHLAGQLLTQTAWDLWHEAAAPGSWHGEPVLLLAHWSIAGASLPNGLPVDQLGEPVLYGLATPGFQAVVAGHIHNAGIFEWVGEQHDRPMLYVGSPACLNFGEALVEHGCWLLTWDGGPFHTEFVPLNDRAFVTVDVDLREAARIPDVALGQQDEAGIIAAVLEQISPLEGSVVRLRYQATEERHRRVDHAALQRWLDDAGVHRVYGGIQWQPDRQTRARVEGVDETLDPLDAVGAWCDANEIDGVRLQCLRELVGWYLAEAA